MTSPCPVCRGAHWVCEEHPDQPWEHDGCGGAGVPCVCNPAGAVEWREVFAEVETCEYAQDGKLN